MEKNSLATKVSFVQDWVSLGAEAFFVNNLCTLERILFSFVFSEYFNRMLGNPWIEVGQVFI